MTDQKSRFGYIAIVGRPNVGKSTLLNRLLGKKISITSKKPQTTRHRILGIKTQDDIQVVYVDTPGLHTQEKRAMNRYLNKAARTALQGVNAVVFVVDALTWDIDDQWILGSLKSTGVPVILAINKVDLMKDQRDLLPYLESVSSKFEFYKVIPISAKKGDQVPVLEQCILDCLPEDLHYYEPDQFTDRNDRFMASEILREKLTRFLGEEVPYAITVTIDAFEETEVLIKIAAVIWVEKETQKAIVIGKHGDRLKLIGTQARQDMERYFEKKVFLKTWVRYDTKPGGTLRRIERADSE